MIARRPAPPVHSPGSQRPPRRVGLAIGKKLYCPNRHHLKEDVVFLHHSGLLRCKYKTPAPGGNGHLGECGIWLLVLMPGPAADDEKRIRIVAEVSREELLELERQHYQTIEEMARFLGISWAA